MAHSLIVRIDRFNPRKVHHFKVTCNGRIAYWQTIHAVDCEHLSCLPRATAESRKERVNSQAPYVQEYLTPILQGSAYCPSGSSLRRFGTEQYTILA